MTPEGYTRVYVGGLNESIKKEDLQMQFEKFGKLNKVWVAFNPPGFAFIEFMNMNEAENACSNMNGTDMMGAKLRVEISRGRGRSNRGGYRDRGYRNNVYGGSQGGGGGGGGGYNNYYGGRAGGSRSRYSDDYSGGRGAPYGSRDSYNQGYNVPVDTGMSYYGGKDYGSSRYRSRSPAGRDRYFSQHLKRVPSPRTSNFDFLALQVH